MSEWAKCSEEDPALTWLNKAARKAMAEGQTTKADVLIEEAITRVMATGISGRG